MKKLLILFVSCVMCHVSCVFAQENNKLVMLTKQILEARTNQELYPLFVELKDLYFKDNKYADFVEFLKSLNTKKEGLAPFTDYYISLSRYQQLKYLEEEQNWDEYFSKGNEYRDELTTDAQKTIDATTCKDPININSRLVLWQFHRDQQDVFHEQALSDLMNCVLEYTKEARDIQPIKDVADKLLSYEEKGKARQLYKIYVDRLIASDIKDDEIKNSASDFKEHGNLELAQNLYDAYIERISQALPKEKLIPILVDIAKSFTYKDTGLNDPSYAEKIFKKIEDLAGKEAFDEDLLYLRAFNLEKAKDYIAAKDKYIDLVERFPKSSHADEAYFKIGIIYTYVSHQIDNGIGYFKELTNKQVLSPQVISSFYQLGLLSQWQEDFTKAKDYYNKLIEKAKHDFSETVTLAKERLKEIEENKSMEYNLKTFLDISLKEEGYVAYDMSKLNLKPDFYMVKKDELVNIVSIPSIMPSGCMSVELQFLWSGDLGTAKPALEASSFSTNYKQAGTKVINLVVVSPTGIIDRNIDILDIY